MSHKKFCPYCGKDNLPIAKFCSGCGYEIPKTQPITEVPKTAPKYIKAKENKFSGMGYEMTKAVHASKSYTGWAFLTLILYWVGFYIIGLIANIAFLSAANKSKRISGVSPSGRGCLIFLIWFHIITLIIIVLLYASFISLLYDILDS